jgi:hypothetical protein
MPQLPREYLGSFPADFELFLGLSVRPGGVPCPLGSIRSMGTAAGIDLPWESRITVRMLDSVQRVQSTVVQYTSEDSQSPIRTVK